MAVRVLAESPRRSKMLGILSLPAGEPDSYAPLGGIRNVTAFVLCHDKADTCAYVNSNEYLYAGGTENQNINAKRPYFNKTSKNVYMYMNVCI